MTKNQEQKDITCKKIAWTITNFSSLIFNVPHYSEVFTVGHCAWRLIIYRGKTGGSTSLAIHLEAADAPSLPEECSILAAFSLTVVNQVIRKNSRTIGDADVRYKFWAKKSNWGYPSFMPLSQLQEPYSVYISNDKCIVEAELFSVKFEGIEPPCHPKNDDVFVEFKDLGKIEKSFVPLLEEVCLWNPSLLECTKNKSRRFTECVFSALGRVLQFLKDKNWKDMNEEEACEELQHMWEELEMIRLDLSWLEPLVKSALNRKGYVEKVEKMKKLKENLVVLETQINKLKETLADTEESFEMIRKELMEAEQDFEEKDLFAEIRYGKP